MNRTGSYAQCMHIYILPFEATKALKILKLFIVDISVYKSVVGTL